MTPNQRRSALAKIHLAKKQLGLDEDTYRQMLNNIGNVNSASELDANGLDKVIAHLQKTGAQFTQKPKRNIGKRPVNADKSAQIGKIEALLAEQKLSWDYALGIAKRMYQKDKLEFCTGRELIAITTALIKRIDKNGAKNERSDSN